MRYTTQAARWVPACAGMTMEGKTQRARPARHSRESGNLSREFTSKGRENMYQRIVHCFRTDAVSFTHSPASK